MSDPNDFEIVLVAMNPVCDFCSGTPIVVAYLIEDFVLTEFKWGSRGAFAACGPCRDLIEGGKVQQLEERAMLAFKIAHATLDIPERVMRRFVGTLHREFWLRLRGGTKH